MRDAAFEHPQVRTAARVAYRFKLDPIAVLAETDMANWVIRLAAAEWIESELNKKQNTGQ